MTAALKHDDAEDAVASTLRRLTAEWAAFEARLHATSLVQRLDRGRFTLEDYRAFLLNLRQQVKEGACWIARAASNVSEPHLELRSTLLRHATAEHRDYLLLEKDFVAAGGRREEIQGGDKNVGSEALSAWMYHEASKPDPFGLLGAMWIIEGLGSIKAKEWGEAIVRQLKLPREAASFLLYHGDNDAEHMKEFTAMLRLVCGIDGVPDRIVKTARVTGRLYALQIEEIDG
jgi:3-oxoacyl-[acyl-carrier-protein] synthase-3